MGAFSPTLQKLRRGDPSSAFDPSYSLDDSAEPDSRASLAFRPALSGPGNASAQPSAFTPTLLRPGETARSATGGANGPGISPVDPSHQYMQDLQDVSGKLSAALASPHPGMGRQVLGALLSAKNPQIGGLVSGETQRTRSIEPLQQEYGLLGKLITANRAQQLAESQERLRAAQEDYFRGRNATAQGGVKNRVESQLNEKGLAGDWDENGMLTGTHPLPASGLSIPATADVNLKDAQADKAAQGPKINDFEAFYKDYLDAKKIPDSAGARLAARREYAAAGQPQQGTLSLQEDAQGNSVLFNSKTGQIKPAGGMQKPGTKAKGDAALAKLTEPVDTALHYAQDYLDNGVHTGPGDEALQEKFFELAKPSTGFRMTQPQMDMLQNSRNWMQSARAHVRHATSGTWFDDDQRAQIVNTMRELGNAKKSALQVGGGVPGAGGGAGANSSAPPLNLLKEGIHTTFKNGQTWTLQNGQPVEVQ